MTKQEQIEEMAKKMYTSVFCEPTCECCKHKKSCIRYRYAERLYNAGYRKLPEDSVVLKIKELEDTCNKCHWVTDYKILKYHEEEVIKLCEQEVKQARKEIAKEIISFIESKDKIGDKYSIYTKLLQELKEKYGEVEE